MPNIAAFAPIPEPDRADHGDGERRLQAQPAYGVLEVLNEALEGHAECDTPDCPSVAFGARIGWKWLVQTDRLGG